MVRNLSKIFVTFQACCNKGCYFGGVIAGGEPEGKGEMGVRGERGVRAVLEGEREGKGEMGVRRERGVRVVLEGEREREG